MAAGEDVIQQILRGWEAQMGDNALEELQKTKDAIALTAGLGVKHARKGAKDSGSQLPSRLTRNLALRT